MKQTLPIVLAALVAVSLTAPAVAARHSEKKDKKTTVQQAPGNPKDHHGRAQSRCLHRSRNGQLFVWSGGRWVPASDANHQAGQNVPSVRTGDYGTTGNPAAANRDVVNGLDWYLNGRGYAAE